MLGRRRQQQVEEEAEEVLPLSERRPMVKELWLLLLPPLRIFYLIILLGGGAPFNHLLQSPNNEMTPSIWLASGAARVREEEVAWDTKGLRINSCAVTKNSLPVKVDYTCLNLHHKASYVN